MSQQSIHAHKGRRLRQLCAVVLVLSLLLVEGWVLAMPSVAKDNVPTPNPDVTFMAGDPINQGGFMVGCSCPKTSGSCVCQISTPR